MTSGRRARVGVVGTGWWATRVHLPSLASYERAELVAIADADPERARAVGERFGVEMVFTDHAEMLRERLDCVLIATPPVAHFAPARDSLLAGADVMIEKPMVVDSAQGRELVALAASTGRRLHVGYAHLHSPHTAQLTALLADGAIGQLRLVTSLYANPSGALYAPLDPDRAPDASDAMFGPRFETYGLRKLGGGQAHGQMTHSLSLLLAVTGLLPREISAYTWGPGIEVDMVDAAAITTHQGPIATLASAGTVPLGAPSFIQLTAFGTDGYAVLDSAAGSLDVIGADGARLDIAALDPSVSFPGHLPARHLVDCFLDDRVPVADGSLGLATTVLIESLLESARRSAPVGVPDLGRSTR
ncbi:MAG: Gfo/Idh/MocA family oxidoreductase [Microbacteriaceae bacterium]|nr:Gfo/Idh/MocA family oxidoreductase [Microbacteriaceae bacterium]